MKNTQNGISKNNISPTKSAFSNIQQEIPIDIATEFCIKALARIKKTEKDVNLINVKNVNENIAEILPRYFGIDIKAKLHDDIVNLHKKIGNKGLSYTKKINDILDNYLSPIKQKIKFAGENFIDDFLKGIDSNNSFEEIFTQAKNKGIIEKLKRYNNEEISKSLVKVTNDLFEKYLDTDIKKNKDEFINTYKQKKDNNKKIEFEFDLKGNYVHKLLVGTRLINSLFNNEGNDGSIEIKYNSEDGISVVEKCSKKKNKEYITKKIIDNNNKTLSYHAIGSNIISKELDSSSVVDDIFNILRTGKTSSCYNEDQLKFMYFLTILIFSCEVDRNPASLIVNAMFLDLINCGEYELSNLDGGVLPMSLEGAVDAARKWVQDLGLQYKFDKKAPSSKSIDNAHILNDRQNDIVLKWLKKQELDQLDFANLKNHIERWFGFNDKKEKIIDSFYTINALDKEINKHKSAKKDEKDFIVKLYKNDYVVSSDKINSDDEIPIEINNIEEVESIDEKSLFEEIYKQKFSGKKGFLCNELEFLRKDLASDNAIDSDKKHEKNCIIEGFWKYDDEINSDDEIRTCGKIEINNTEEVESPDGSPIKETHNQKFLQNKRARDNELESHRKDLIQYSKDKIFLHLSTNDYDCDKNIWQAYDNKGLSNLPDLQYEDLQYEYGNYKELYDLEVDINKMMVLSHEMWLSGYYGSAYNYDL